MIGGGLGDFAPGEWTDDTAQAVAIAEVAATGLDLRSPEALTAIAQRFADWYADGPADVGIQTAHVLQRAGRTPTGAAMAAAAARFTTAPAGAPATARSCAPDPSPWPTSTTPRRSSRPPWRSARSPTSRTTPARPAPSGAS